MTSATLHAQATRFTRPMPAIQPGFTVRVHERIQEGNKERVQVFEGLVIATHNGHVPTDATFTVRKIVSGVGVEKVFAIHSPVVEKVEVKKVAKVRRAKLFFLRGRAGKKARLSERFTSEGEFVPEAVGRGEGEEGNEGNEPQEASVPAPVAETQSAAESAPEEKSAS